MGGLKASSVPRSILRLIFSKKANFSENRKLGWRGLRESRDWGWNEPRLGLADSNLWFGWLHWDQSSGLASASKPGSVCKPSILGQDLLGQKGSNRFDNIKGLSSREKRECLCGEAWALLRLESFKLIKARKSQARSIPTWQGKGFYSTPIFSVGIVLIPWSFIPKSWFSWALKENWTARVGPFPVALPSFFCFKLVLLRKLRNTKKNSTSALAG